MSQDNRPRATAAQVTIRYIRGMEKRGHIFPGSAAKIVGRPEIARHGGDPAAALNLIDRFMEGPGRRYVDPEKAADPNPVRAALGRFGVGEERAAELYRKHAADMVEHSDAPTRNPSAAAYRILDAEGMHAHLGSDLTPREVAEATGQLRSGEGVTVVSPPVGF